jgi:Ca-activated chloride channel family protein
LITDGEIHEHEKLVKRAEKSGHRVFTVGVGNAVAEVFLKSLSSATGGACELVAPQEGMTERVLQQFHRMRQPKLGKFNITWPAMPIWQTSLPDTVFAGDTVNVFAGFQNVIYGDVTLDVAGVETIHAAINKAHEPEIPRIAAARRMVTATQDEKLHLALDYQLLSPLTNYLVVAERDAKAKDLPELHHIPQMLAAGWGGAGVDALDIPLFSRNYSSDSLMDNSVSCKLIVNYSSMPEMPIVHRNSTKVSSKKIKLGYMNPIPSFLRKREVRSSTKPSVFIKILNAKYAGITETVKLLQTIADLVKAGLDNEIEAWLMSLVSSGLEQEDLVIAFLYALSQSSVGDQLDRSLNRVILKAYKQSIKNTNLDEDLKHGLSKISNKEWDWQAVTITL